MEDYLMHYGVKGQKWGIRRWMNEDGTLTAEGKIRYEVGSDGKMSDYGRKLYNKHYGNMRNGKADKFGHFDKKYQKEYDNAIANGMDKKSAHFYAKGKVNTEKKIIAIGSITTAAIAATALTAVGIHQINKNKAGKNDSSTSEIKKLIEDVPEGKPKTETTPKPVKKKDDGPEEGIFDSMGNKLKEIPPSGEKPTPKPEPKPKQEFIPYPGVSKKDKEIKYEKGFGPGSGYFNSSGKPINPELAGSTAPNQQKPHSEKPINFGDTNPFVKINMRDIGKSSASTYDVNHPFTIKGKKLLEGNIDKEHTNLDDDYLNKAVELTNKLKQPKTYLPNDNNNNIIVSTNKTSERDKTYFDFSKKVGVVREILNKPVSEIKPADNEPVTFNKIIKLGKHAHKKGGRMKFGFRHSIDLDSSVEDFLMHYGIKGQKWGVQRWTNPDGTLNDAGRERYGYGSKAQTDAVSAAGEKATKYLTAKGITVDSLGSKEKYAEIKKAKTNEYAELILKEQMKKDGDDAYQKTVDKAYDPSISGLQAGKNIADSSRGLTSNTKNLVNDLYNPGYKRLDLSKMSTKELQDAIDRENKERTFNEYFNPEAKKAKAGKEKVTKMLDVAGDSLSLVGGAAALAVSILTAVKLSKSLKTSKSQ